MVNLKLGCVDPRKVKRKKCNFGWKPPPDGFLKFNVDGSSRGNPGPSGIGVIIESNSSLVVLWVNGAEGVGQVRFLDSILEIREILYRLNPKVSVRFVNRRGNVAAGFLGKQGALHGLVQLVWSS
ncbi:hypothetical protein Q3G72_021177 [Acer saccharum]|nr:hypothetical protein Q3G72_021177 [Acer saccharum]